MASVSESRLIAASPPEVWGVLSDVENAQRWNSAWTRIEITSGQRHGLGTTFVAQTEGGEKYAFEICGWSPPEQIAFSPIRGEEESFGVMLDSHEFRLSPADEGATVVRLTAHATARGLRGHVIARLFWPGYQRHGLELALDALQAVFEPEPGAEEGAAETGSLASE